MSQAPLAQSLEGAGSVLRRHSWHRFIDDRPYVFLPASLLLTLFAFTDPAPWRGPVAAGGVAILIGYLVASLRRVRAPASAIGEDKLYLPAFLQVAALLVTGGLDSPFLGYNLLLCVMAGALGVRRRVVLFQGGLLLAMAIAQIRGWPPDVLPAVLGGAAHAHRPVHLLTTATAQTLLGLLAHWLGSTLRRGYDGAIAESVRARDELVRLGAAHAAELQAVCGEVSHELKNPLATIRGLGELMALDAPGPRNAERLQVLVGEAMRMQASLEELLNLARPLSPLELAPVDLAALRAEVCALHEGLCASTGVALATPAPDGPERAVPGDRRKLRQALVNLVQNAIEASAPGATVTVTLRSADERAAVEVEDEGAGLDASVGDRAFEPGVTTKKKGNGLGLTIARTIAWQHGGDIVLRPRSPKGCVAALLLPRERGLTDDAPIPKRPDPAQARA